MTALSRASRATELSLVVMAVIWGVNFSVMKYGTQVMAPVAFNALRMGIACVILFAIAYGRPGLRPSVADRNRLLGLGVLGHFVYQLLFLQGLSMTRAGTAALVVAASPAAVAIVARSFGHEKLPMRAVVGIVLSIAGVMLVVGGSVQADGTSHLLGDLLILGAVVVWAFYTTGLVPLAQHVEPAQVAAWTLIGGVVPLALFASPALLRTDWTAVTPLTWAAVAYSGILAMVIAYLVWYHGVRAIGPTRTAMFANLQPLVAVLVAWAILGEVPTVFQGAGAGAVLGGLYLARR
jgi:drug/metabolite transporter (DMT)-like permease